MAGGPEQLTRREGEILAAVELRLTNAEIADAFSISLRTVESHIAALRRKLDADSRAKLVEAAQARRRVAVPVPRNSFVGRAADVDAVRGLLARERWVTVVGPSGCGKTRLALEIAATSALVPVVAELDRAGDADVAPVVARALGLDGEGDALLGALGLTLAARPHLLVLDTCERVQAGVLALVGRLLARVPSLAVLATSASPVGGAEEVVHSLAPLPGPDAVRLFLDRATAAAPQLMTGVAGHDRDLAARICLRLDGLPLALELAAARVRHLPLAELEARLEAGFAALDRAGPPSRHRTLETAFAWTWDALDDDERDVLTRLAALPGPFDLGTADAVRPGGSGLVFRLLDRSLLLRTGRPEEPATFRMLDAVRVFAAQRAHPGTFDEVRAAHAARVAEVAGALARAAALDDSRAAGEASDRLAPDLAAALEWAVLREAPVTLSLACSASILLERYSGDTRALAALTTAARAPVVRAAAGPRDLATIGVTLCAGDLELVAELAHLAREAAAAPADLLAARMLAGFADAYRGAGRAALIHLAEAERLALDLGDVGTLGSVHQAQGLAYRQRDALDPDAALAAYSSAQAAYARAGDAFHVNNVRYMMAMTALDAGRPTAEAVAQAEACAAYARRTGNSHELAHALLVRGGLLGGRRGEPDLREAVDRLVAIGDLRCLVRCYLRLADLEPPAGRVELLQRAADIAASAHDLDHRVTALERLVGALAVVADPARAAVAFGEFAAVAGDIEARRRCPASLLPEIEARPEEVARGRARALRRPVS